MSIVAVHGPNTFGVAGGSGAVTNAGGTVTPDMSNGLKFTLAGTGDRPAADYDWTFSDGTAAIVDTKTGTVTFATAGAKTITLTVGTSGGTTPAGGTYTFNVTAVSGPRSAEEGAGELGSGEPGAESYDPGDHTVAEVQAYADTLETAEEVQALLDAEVANKNRSTLVAYLESMLPYDPEDHTVQEVVDYAEANPDELEAIIAAEQAGKNRSTLLSQLEALRTA